MGSQRLKERRVVRGARRDRRPAPAARWLDRIQTDAIAEFAVVYGYWPCYSEGNELVVLHLEGMPPTQPQNCSATPSHGRPAGVSSASPTSSVIVSWRLKGPDVVAFHLVTMGSQVAKVTASLFEQNAYRDYLELHGSACN